MSSQRKPTSARTIIGWATLVALLFALWWWVLPPGLGGRTTLLTTRGVSMEPLLHDGDLAILHKQQSYKVGDIVEYHSSALNAPVLHRIIAVNGSKYSTKGDNNDFVDLDSPTNKQIVGKMVHRYTGYGKYIGWVKSTPARIVGAALMGLAVYQGLARSPEKKRRRIATASRRTNSSGDDSEPTSTQAAGTTTSQNKVAQLIGGVRQFSTSSSLFIAAFASITAMSLLLAGIAYSHPTSKSSDELAIYNLHGVFNYSAPATGGDLVYRDGQVQTGDTIYTAMVNNLFVTYDYQLESIGSKFKGGGTIALDAEIKGSSGWTHPLTFSAPTEFTGEQAKTTANIDLSQISTLVKQIDGLTKVPSSNYTLTLKPNVTIDGTLDGQKLQTTFDSSLDLTANGTTIKPTTAPAAGDNKTTGPTGLNESKDVLTGLQTAKGGELHVGSSTPQALKTFGMTLGIMALRTISTIGLAIGIGGLAFAFATRRKRKGALPPESRYASDLKQYQDLFVPVANWGQVDGRSMIIDVPSLEDLARIAETHQVLILQEKSPEHGDVFVVNHSHLTYRYQFDPLAAAERRFGVREESTSTPETVGE